MDLLSIFENNELDSMIQLLTIIRTGILEYDLNEDDMFAIGSYFTVLEEAYVQDTDFGEMVIVPPEEALRFSVSHLLAYISYLLTEGIENQIDFNPVIIGLIDRQIAVLEALLPVDVEDLLPTNDEINDLLGKSAILGVGVENLLCYDTPFIVRIPFVNGVNTAWYDPTVDTIFITTPPKFDPIHPYARILYEFGRAFHNRLTLNMEIIPEGYELIFSKNASLQSLQEGFAQGFAWAVCCLNQELKEIQFASPDIPELVIQFAVDYFTSLASNPDPKISLIKNAAQIKQRWSE